MTFPNTQDLPPGSKAYIFSFDHDSGQWETIGTGTVSEDGTVIESDPGVGILAPGWHGAQPGTQPEIPQPDPEEEECDGTKILKETKESLLTQIDCAVELIPLKKGWQLAAAKLMPLQK